MCKWQYTITPDMISPNVAITGPWADHDVLSTDDKEVDYDDESDIGSDNENGDLSAIAVPLAASPATRALALRSIRSPRRAKK